MDLRCSPRQAYGFFTENEKLAEWLAAEADVEPRLGGKYELPWNPHERETDSNIGSRITAFVPDALLAFEWRGPLEYHDLMNFADPLTHVSVFFLPIEHDGERWTRIRLVHTGWRSTPDWEGPWAFFDNAWKMVFARLKQRVDEGETPPAWRKRPQEKGF